MEYSSPCDSICLIDEYKVEIAIKHNGRTLYKIIYTGGEELKAESNRWKLSPYDVRNENYMAEYDFASGKEGLVMYSPESGREFITEPFIWDYARVFVGKPRLIAAVGNNVDGKIKCAIKVFKRPFLTEPIYDGIYIGEEKHIVEVHLGDEYWATVDLNDKDTKLQYTLPFLKYKHNIWAMGTPGWETVECEGNPFKNVRLYIDTETTGLPIDYKEHYSKLENWPHIVQIAFIIEDDNYGILAKRDIIVKPDGYTIPESSSKIHGITNKKAESGEKREDVFEFLDHILNNTNIVIGHNASFDLNIIKAEIVRTKGLDNVLFEKAKQTVVDTMRIGKDLCKMPGSFMYGGYKYPKLDELYYKLFNKHFENQHNAMADIEATFECYKELVKLNLIVE